MFEGAVSYILNRFLGKYVQNLDSSNLNVSIFKGDVELSDIQLRPEALVELKLPIEVKAGYVGYIKIDIPWTSLFSASVVAHLDDVYILAGPITDRMYDAERERALQNAIKREMLESLEASAISKVADSAGEDPGFFEKLYTYVINNIQVTIGNVHVRYEDMVTNPDHPFACGLMLKHISGYTTNSKWQPSQLDSSATVIYKLLEMSELSFYWNPYIPEQHLLRSRLNTDGWRNLLKQSITTHRIFEEDFDFVIEPVSAETRLIISKDNNTTMPKFFADVTLQEIEILLSRQQFLNVLSLQDSFRLMAVNQQYRKYHPNVPLKISPRSWWMYAYTAVVEERIRPYSWERIKEHRTKYRKYKELYKKSLKLSADHESMKSKLRELEEGLDVCNIVIAREQAKAEYAPEKKVTKPKEEKGWWDRWFGSSDDEEEEVEVEIHEEKDWLSRLTPEEKADLYKGIGYDKNANIAKLPKEYIEHKVQVNLKSCCLSLVNYSKKILQVSVTQMLGSWETRPAGKAFRVSCHTESFSVEGASIEHDLVPVVTSDVNVYAPSVNQVFTLDFESNPLYVDADYSLKTNIQPVEVVYDEHSICEVKAFFQLPNGNIDMKTMAYETLQNVAKISQAGLIYAIQQHTTLHVAVNMKSPYVVIPEFGTLHRGGNVLIADLGMLQIKSELQPKDNSLWHGNLSESEIASRLYDQFNITITDIKILLADSGDDWHTAQIQPTSEYHILPSTKLILDFYNSVKPDYKQLPQQKVITTLPTFEVNISDKRLMVLWKFFRNFPLPTSTSIGALGEDVLDGAMLTSVSLDDKFKPVPKIDLTEVQLEPDVNKLRRMKRSVLGRRVVNKVKRPEETIPSIVSDEIDTPYMEGEEAEAWSKYEDIKPVDDISSTHNTTNILVRIVIREVVIQLFKGLDKQENPYLMFRADRLRLDAAVTEYGFAAHASLGAIQLVDKIHIGTSGEYLELLSTKEGTDLVSVLYRKVDIKCPDFEENYYKVEQGVKVEFQTLHLLLDQGAIMYLRAYIEGLMTSIHSLEMVTSASTMVSSVVSATTRQISKQKSSSTEESEETEEPPSSVVQFNVIAHLHDLSVTLADNNSKIAEMHIRDLEGHGIKRVKKFAVKGRLKDIDIKDVSHGAIYPNILMLDEEEESLFKFSFLQNLELREDITDNKQEEQFFDYKLNLRVGHLQAVALGKFYWELNKFVEPFLSQEFIDTASVAMETVSKQVGDFKNENKRFGLNIEMMSPTIMIPQNSTSTDLILLKSGVLHIQNVFDTTEIGQGVKQEWNHIYVSLTDVLLQRAKLSTEDDTYEILSRVLDPLTFQMDLRLILEPEIADVQTDISAKLDKVNGSLSQRDLQVIMGILRQNWKEGAPQPDPEPVIATLHHRPSIESGTVVMETPMATSVSSKKTSAAVLFTLEGMELTLFQDTETDELRDFAVLNIGKISGTTYTMGDGEVKVTVALETISVSDIRPDSKFAIKKVLYYDEESVNKDEDSKRPLVSVIYKMSGDGNQKADIMMEKVIINVQIPYIMELSAFFTESLSDPDEKKQVTSPAGVINPAVPVPVPVTSPDHQTPVMTVYCSVKQPEIVLFADPESDNSRILVMNADIAFEFIASSVQQKMWSKVTTLKMYSSIYGAPSSQNSRMLSPCDLEFTRCFNTEKNELQMFVKCPKINIHLTPVNLKLLLDVVEILKNTSVQPSDSGIGEDIAQPKEDLWNIKTVKSQHWIDKYNETESVGPVFGPVEPPIESFTVEVEEMCAFFDVENLDQTVPLLCLRSSLDAKVINWSKHMRLNAELELDVCFYNEKLSVWEPLIEPTLVQEGEYKPWQLRAQMFQAQSFPIVCNYDDNGLDVPDGLQNDVESLISRNPFQSSSSENEADEAVDSPSEMTILRPKVTRRKIRINSDKSYGPEGLDEPDGRVSDLPEPEVSDEDEGPSCTYLILSSQEKLHVNVTPQAINVLRDVLESLSQTKSSGLLAATKLPALEIYNKLGLHAEVVVHRSVKVHEDYVHDCTVCHPGDPRQVSPPVLDDINIITEEGEEEEKEEDEDTLSSQRRPLTFVNQTLAEAGHMLISAGAFVFEDDVMSGSELDRGGVQLQISGFDPSPALLMNRACRKLVPLTPKQHATKYYIVYDVDMNHSHKTLTIQSPLQLKNSLTMAVDLFVKKTELHTFKRNNKSAAAEEFTKLGTVEPRSLYHVPLYAAYHCAIYVCPTGLPYEKTSYPIWWPDLVQNKDRSRFFTCLSDTDNKLFHMKVCCEEGEPLKPSQMITRTIPYFTLNLHPPVIIHNYLPYDLQFALEGSSSPSSLTHGESTPLYTIDVDKIHKLNLFVADYLACDWKGTLEITKDMEEFKAIIMDTDVDPDNNNKHLSLSVHFNLTETCNLYIYSPYWIVNKTDLTFQIRGSMSDTVLECGPTNYPQLFRYKKNKRKKAKLKVLDSHWSHSFSLDTIGNYGVVECCDTQRKCKYTFMVQCQMSRLKLTKIITVTPFFLVVNQSSRALRYMEENKHTDLWFDLAIGQCSPFWPVTDSYNMLVKYERSNVVSQHFPFKRSHNTVLRMKNGTALCVSVAGGYQSPITVTFQDYDHGDAPVRVENFCDDVFIKIHQKNQSQTTILSSNQTVLYTWDDPSSERTLMWNVYGRSKPNYPAAINKDGYGHVNLKLKSLKSSGTFDYVDAPETTDSSPEDESDETDGLMGKLDESLIGKTRSDKLVIHWVSYLDHQQRVLLFTQDERIAKGARKMNDAEQANNVVFVSLDGLVVSVINSGYQEVALLSVSSVPAVWEVEVNNRWKILNVELQTWLEDQWRNKQGQTNLQEQFEADLNKMQMLKPYMGALRRSYNPGLWLNYRMSKHHKSLHAKVQRIQLDNQLPDAYFPSVLYPSPTPVYIVKKKGQKPFIEVGLMRRTVPENNVDTFRYFKVLVQEFNVKIDKGFIMSLYDVFAHLLTTEESESSQLQSDLLLAQRSLQEVAAILASERPGRIYFEYLRLSPLKMHVSFSLNGTAHVAKENKPTIVSDIVDFFLSSVGATLTEMKDVELRMAYFEVKGAALSWKQLADQIQSHYTHQAVQQAYVLILGLDVLGNPYGLIKDFTQGFGDLFYEPFLDSVQGSDEFADSLVRGVHSLLGNTVGGAAGSVARITGSVGGALAALSFDQDYKRKRRAALQQRPNLPLSLVLAGRGFVMGVCLGLSGIVLDPIRGAQEEGVEGFFKGVGKGIMGLLTKPAGGVFDMVSMAFDGVQRAAEVDVAVVHRMRKPRFINGYMGLRPYSVYQADGYNLLLGLNKGQYAKSDVYWAHAPLSPGERADMLLITDRNILLIQKRRCWGGWDIEWEVKVDDVLGVPAVVADKLVFKIKQDESSVNLFAGGEQEISSTDPDLLKWIQKRIENLMKYKQR